MDIAQRGERYERVPAALTSLLSNCQKECSSLVICRGVDFAKNKAEVVS